MNRGRIDSLQALRAIAAALVVVFHMDSFMPSFMGFDFAGEWFVHGEAGVDIFFVLSGFIIYYSVKARGGMTRRDFLIARFVRLYPIYWTVMLALIAAELLRLTSGNPERLDPATILRSLLLLPSPDYVIVVAWTLAIEVIFYAIFAIFFFFDERWFLAAMVLWAATAMGAPFLHLDSGPYWFSGYLLYGGVAEFTFGCLIAYWCHHHELRGGALALGVGVLGFLLGLAGAGPLMGFGREITFGVPSALIVYGAYVLSPRTPRWLVGVGDSSYVLYLTHGILLSILFRVVRATPAQDLIGNQLTAWIVAAVTVGLAYLIHRLVERPLLSWLRSSMLGPSPTLARG